MSHAVLAPSSADQWRWCAGGVSLSQGIGDEDTDASRDGTAAHWVGEQMLESFRGSTKRSADFVGQPAPNGVIVTEEMYEAAYLYVHDILTVCNETGLLRELHVEERLTMPEIHEQCWGTPDCWTFDVQTMTMYVWDFKFGHSSVIAYENWQMICYALGALRKVTNNQPLGEHGITVVMRIVQPRCYDSLGPVREWKVAATALRGYVNQLSVAALKVFDPAVQCTTGNHCKNCDGAVHCPAIRNATAAIVDHSGNAIPEMPDDNALAYELSVLADAQLLLKQRKQALEVEAEHRLRNGGKLPGWHMEQGYGHNKWLYPDAEVLAMGQLMGVDLLADPVPLAPAKACAKLKKNNVDASVISSYYAKPTTSMKLKADDGETARIAFLRSK